MCDGSHMRRHGPIILLNRHRCEAYTADVRADREASRSGILDRMIIESQVLNGHTLDRVLRVKATKRRRRLQAAEYGDVPKHDVAHRTTVSSWE